jgi:acyl-CoA reductase-like NAD-dependent aldehyde dehydrogenase
LIGGEWVAAADGATFENRNPARPDQLLGTFPVATRDDAKRAIAAAREALPGWANTPPPARGAILDKASQIITARLDQMALALTREEGKTLAEAKGEVTRARDILRYYSGEGWRNGGDVLPNNAQGELLYTRREPLGVVAIITPWNFPIAIPTWKIAPALIYGNTVVFKPASDAPEIGMLLVEALVEAGLPPGVLNFVTGSGRVVGDGAADGMQMGPAVNQRQLETDLKYIQIGRDEGARLVAGGAQTGDGGYFVQPTVFDEVAPEMRIAQEEIFGPLISVIRAQDFDDALAKANAISYGLSAGVVTNDLHKAFAFANNVEAGVVKINQPTTGLALHVPFGGFKHSSSNTFKEQGQSAIEFYTRTKTIYMGHG